MDDGPLSVVLLHWGRTGAGPRFTFELARAMRARDDVRVAVSDVAGAERSAAFAALGGPRLAVRTYTTSAGVVLGLPRLVANVVRFRRFLRQTEADVVVTPMFSLWQSLAIRALVPRRVALVATVHDATPHPGEDRVAQRWAQAAEVGRADAIVVLSENVAAGVRDRWNPTAPVHVTVHGAFGSGTPASPRPAPTNRPPVLGFFGRILPYKGLDLLVEAAGCLAEDGMSVSVHVHGDGDVPAALLEREDTVEWHLGWVPEEATNRVVATFDVLVLPYREASQSGVLALAMSEGVPVVATPVGGLREQVETSGCGVVTTDVSARSLADGVKRLLTEEGRYEACSRRGIEAAASDHGWARVASDYVTAIAAARAARRQDPTWTR